MSTRKNKSGSERVSTGGFTLIEATLTLVLLSLIGLTSAYVTTEAAMVQSRTEPRLEASYRARLACEWLQRDIRDLVDPASITVFTPTALEFLDPSGNVVSYAYSAGDLTRNGDLLASGLTTFGLRYWRANGSPASAPNELRLVELDLVVQVGTQKEVAHVIVFPRSLGP